MPMFQNESKCETFHMKMSSACSFIFMQIKVIFIRMVSHLVSLLKQRHKGTQKWPIARASVVVGQLFIFIIRLMLGVSCMFQETRIR